MFEKKNSNINKKHSALVELFNEDGEEDNVTLETPSFDEARLDKTQMAGSQPSETSEEDSGEREILGEFAVDRITAHMQDPDAKEDDWIAHVKWVAYREQTGGLLDTYHVRRSCINASERKEPR